MPQTSRFLIPLLTALALAAPLAAQEWQVARERFVFVGTRLTILVDAEAPGSLRLIRGAAGSVRVTSRAKEGFTTSGLADNDRLTLSAAGQGPVDYLVAVPENVRVDVRIPGTRGERLARGRTGAWEWSATERPEAAPVTEWLPGAGLEHQWDSPLYTTFTRDQAPLEVSLPELAFVARITVRIEGTRFRVAASRPLSVQEGAADRLVILPAGPPMELALGLPAATTIFTLRLGGVTALILDGVDITTLCTPVTEQRLSNGRRWFTFNPLDGSLQCSAESVQRHGG